MCVCVCVRGGGGASTRRAEAGGRESCLPGGRTRPPNSGDVREAEASPPAFHTPHPAGGRWYSPTRRFPLPSHCDVPEAGCWRPISGKGRGSPPHSPSPPG